MALKKIVVVAVFALSATAFASSRVEEALSLNTDSPAAKKSEKSKAAPKKVFDSLNASEAQKTELPKNARHDATAGVFI
jgi:hypothetical protein